MRFVSLFLCLAICTPSFAQSMAWKEGNGFWGLYKGDAQIGWTDGMNYRPYDKGQFGAQAQPPIPLPTFGVDVGRVEDDLKKRIGDLTDDSKKLRIVVIGEEAQRKEAIAAIAGLPEKDSFVVQGFSPGAWQLKCGHQTSGNPTIYCQSPDGQVLHRQDSFDGVDSLAGALRKAKAGYDAKKDPDLRKTQIPTPAASINGVLLLSGLAAALILYQRKKVLHA